MNGEVAQVVALTCHGNAFLDGKHLPRFFPENSTCTFCDSICFIEFRRRLFGGLRESQVAKSPDDWIASLGNRGAIGLRLFRQAQNDPRIPDRMSAGFVGGGGDWLLEVRKKGGRSEYWGSKWEVWNQNAPDQRIWRVKYALLRDDDSRQDQERSVADVKADFSEALRAIHHFSSRENCGGFTDCFANALLALDDPKADVGYHKDLALPRQLSADAQSLLKASMSAWVFGGMGSWNDMGFDGDKQEEYEAVSERLFQTLNEAIQTSASSSAKFLG